MAGAKIYQIIRNGIVFELQSEEEGGYTITVPSLPGCISYGHSFEESLEMIKEAIAGWLEVAKEEGIPIPEHFTTLHLAAI